MGHNGTFWSQPWHVALERADADDVGCETVCVQALLMLTRNQMALVSIEKFGSA